MPSQYTIWCPKIDSFAPVGRGCPPRSLRPSWPEADTYARLWSKPTSRNPWSMKYTGHVAFHLLGVGDTGVVQQNTQLHPTEHSTSSIDQNVPLLFHLC